MRATVATVFLLLLLCSPPAGASLVITSSVEDMTRLSTLVVRGEVLRTKSVRVEGKGLRTHVTLRVDETLKGEAPGGTVTVSLPGGREGELVVKVPGTPNLAPGEELVLFLEGRGADFVVCGQEQGRFLVRRPEAGAPAQVKRRFSGELALLDPDRPDAAPTHARDDTQSLEALRQRVRATVLRHGPAPEPLPRVFPRLAPARLPALPSEG